MTKKRPGRPAFSGIRNMDVAADTEDARWNDRNADEFLFWPRAMWIDPGGVTGLAVVWFDPLAVSQGQPLRRCVLGWHERFVHGPEKGLQGQISQILKLRRLLSAEPGLLFGCEDFIPRQTNYSREFLAPVRIGRTIDWYGSVRDFEVHFQSASDAKSTFDDGRLKEYGMYTAGPDHVRDATRHALLSIRKMRGMTPEQMFEFIGLEEDWYDR